MSHEELVAKSLPNRRILAIPKRLHVLWRQVEEWDWQTLDATWSVIERLRTDAFDHGVFLVGKNLGHQWVNGVTFDTRAEGVPLKEEAATLAQLMAIDSFVKHFESGAIDMDAICGMKPGYEGCNGSAWLAHWLRNQEILRCIGPVHTPEVWMSAKSDAKVIWDLLQAGREAIPVQDYKFIRGFIVGMLEVWIAMRGPLSPQRI